MKTVEGIVKTFLIENGYEGLYHEDDCGCEIGDLAPCGEINGECIAGYKIYDRAGDWVIGPRNND